MRYDPPRCLDAGEAALTVEFGDCVDPEINARVLALDAALAAAAPAGVLETVPTYRSLTIHYEPLTISRADVIALALALAGAPAPARPQQGGALWTVPCCYDPPHGEDLAEAARLLGLSPQRVAELHAGALYRAYMYGFAPGWLYLGGLPQALALPRRASPRGPTPPGAVLIGGGLALIGADPMPTGWHVLGRTPERLFAPQRDPPFLMRPGDGVRFARVGLDAFAQMEALAKRGEIISAQTNEA